MVGRTAELAAVASAAVAGRLVTVVGPGGAGKSRLVAEHARPTANGPQFSVACAAARSPQELVEVVAQVVLAGPARGPLVDALLDVLRSLQPVLILDDVDQVRGCGDLLSAWLSAAPTLRLLVTARTPLGVAGERIVRVGGLAVPPTDDVAAVLTSPAGQLFLALVREVRPGYDLVPSDPATARDAGHVASICRRLDGLPLGMEIVAARSKIRSMVELAAEMSDLASIRRPDTAAPQRHLSVAAAVDWSYQLLDDDSAGALRFLSLVESAGPTWWH